MQIYLISLVTFSL